MESALGSDLIVDVCITLPPGEVVQQNGICWISDGSSVKAGNGFQGFLREVLLPSKDIAG